MDDRFSVLIIEDDDFTASLLTFMFEREGLRVTRVADGGAGQRALQGDQPFDVVLLEWMLPKVSGLELLTLAKATGWVVPMVVLSSLDTGADVARAFKAGASDHVSRPFNPQELLARVRRLLPQRPRGA